MRLQSQIQVTILFNESTTFTKLRGCLNHTTMAEQYLQDQITDILGIRTTAHSYLTSGYFPTGRRHPTPVSTRGSPNTVKCLFFRLATTCPIYQAKYRHLVLQPLHQAGARALRRTFCRRACSHSLSSVSSLVEVPRSEIFRRVSCKAVHSNGLRSPTSCFVLLLRGRVGERFNQIVCFVWLGPNPANTFSLY